MISKKRLFELRLSNVLGLIGDQMRFCDSVTMGTHKMFRALGSLRWLDLPCNKGKEISDYFAWKHECQKEAKERYGDLNKRRLRVLKIAELQA